MLIEILPLRKTSFFSMAGIYIFIKINYFFKVNSYIVVRYFLLICNVYSAAVIFEIFNTKAMFVFKLLSVPLI